MNVTVPDYTDKSDDELLNLSLDFTSLTPEAGDALKAELNKRGLGSSEHLSRFAEEQKRADLAELNDRIKKLRVSWRGNGRKLYGKSGVEVSGMSEEYNATLFLVASYIPLIPTGTYRLSREQGTENFHVLEKRPIDWGQVAWIWMKTIVLIVAAIFGLYALHSLGVIK